VRAACIFLAAGLAGCAVLELPFDQVDGVVREGAQVARAGAAEQKAALAAAGGLALVVRRRLGGLTGDVYGAAIELAELVFLLVAAAR